MDELLRLSLVDLLACLERKRVSPVELMQAVLARVEATHGDLNALVIRRDADELLAEAREAEDRYASGRARPLEGIPLGVKDLEDVAGLVTTSGSRLFAERVAEGDDIHIGRLKAAGAIVVGKTNTPEFGFTAITKNLVFGTSRSPWNLERTPGGSSGGSAALLAGCVLPLVTASDGGGSIRIPASFTGAFGLKVSHGRVPRGPIKRWDTTQVSVYGPLTKTVEDAALFLDQVVGPDAGDPTSLPHPEYSYRERLEEPIERRLRIAFSPDLGYAVVQADVAAAVEEAARVLEGLGHRLEPIAGGPPLLTAVWGRLGAFANAGQLDEYLDERPDDITRSFYRGMNRARQMSAREYYEAAVGRAQLTRWCADLFADYDLLITPTVSFDPPPAKGPFPEEIDGRRQPPAAAGALTIPFNLSWNPAASVRAGLSSAGLPIGMQIVGPQHRDDLVLQAARAYERERPWHPEWPADLGPPAAGTD